MSRKREIKELLGLARKAGLIVERAKSNHWHIRNRDGKLVTTLPGSPDGPFRRKAISDFKRHGIIDCDPKLAGQRGNKRTGRSVGIDTANNERGSKQ